MSNESIDTDALSARLSRAGPLFCSIYLVAVAICVGMAVGADLKGRHVLLQLPLALQFALLDALGATRYLAGLSWPVAYALVGLPTLLVLYYAGAMLESMLRSLAPVERPGP
jgi:hypothetical protein